MNDSNRTAAKLRLYGRLLTLIVVISLALTVWAGRKKAILPIEQEILADVKSEPEQKERSERAIKLDWKGAHYVLYPVAEYDIRGMVVTRNDIRGFTDIYHTSSSVDVVDVCLIWGDNTREAVYRNSEFWSEPFSCWYRPKNDRGAAAFHSDQLSNTHLLAKDESLAKQLNSIRLGDQIRLTGKLVNYHPAGASEQMRKSSLVRSDSGNGACEVMYVEAVQFLNRANPGWNKLYSAAKSIFWIALVLKFLSFLTFPYIEYRAR